MHTTSVEPSNHSPDHSRNSSQKRRNSATEKAWKAAWPSKRNPVRSSQNATNSDRWERRWGGRWPPASPRRARRTDRGARLGGHGVAGSRRQLPPQVLELSGAQRGAVPGMVPSGNGEGPGEPRGAGRPSGDRPRAPDRPARRWLWRPRASPSPPAFSSASIRSPVAVEQPPTSPSPRCPQQLTSDLRGEAPRGDRLELIDRHDPLEIDADRAERCQRNQRPVAAAGHAEARPGAIQARLPRGASTRTRSSRPVSAQGTAPEHDPNPAARATIRRRRTSGVPRSARRSVRQRSAIAPYASTNVSDCRRSTSQRRRVLSARDASRAAGGGLHAARVDARPVSSLGVRLPLFRGETSLVRRLVKRLGAVGVAQARTVRSGRHSDSGGCPFPRRPRKRARSLAHATSASRQVSPLGGNGWASSEPHRCPADGPRQGPQGPLPTAPGRRARTVRVDLRLVQRQPQSPGRVRPTDRPPPPPSAPERRGQETRRTSLAGCEYSLMLRPLSDPDPPTIARGCLSVDIAAGIARRIATLYPRLNNLVATFL